MCTYGGCTELGIEEGGYREVIVGRYQGGIVGRVPGRHYPRVAQGGITRIGTGRHYPAERE